MEKHFFMMKLLQKIRSKNMKNKLSKNFFKKNTPKLFSRLTLFYREVNRKFIILWWFLGDHFGGHFTAILVAISSVRVYFLNSNFRSFDFYPFPWWPSWKSVSPCVFPMLLVPAYSRIYFLVKMWRVTADLCTKLKNVTFKMNKRDRTPSHSRTLFWTTSAQN